MSITRGRGIHGDAWLGPSLGAFPRALPAQGLHPMGSAWDYTAERQGPLVCALKDFRTDSSRACAIHNLDVNL